MTYSEISINLSNLEVWRNGQKISLTPKEFALMEFFMRNKERVISKQELLEKVWNLTHEISTNVIEVYVNYLRNKIDKGFDKRLIHTHFGMGYISEGRIKMKIRSKLTVQFISITAAIFIVALYFIYKQFEFHIENEQYTLLESKALMTAEMVLQR
jgi:DNA-binding winged helix-turn-helix (wHTH) protein